MVGKTWKLLLFSLCIVLMASPLQGQEPIKVFVLAGQSNMEGKGRVSLLEKQIVAPETKEQFAHLHENGEWIERDDVWIKFLNRKGRLTVGFGSPGCIGPELEFGNRVGDELKAPVLLIKTAWGGKSLYQDFRPPSSGLPAEEALAKQLENQQKRNPDATMDELKASYGHFYREMIKEVKESLAAKDELFPELAGRDVELAGLVWFQGWNDMIDPMKTAEYTDNMVNFIRDARRDLDAPKLPVVIGQMGVDGTEGQANEKRDKFKEAQAAAAELDEFQGNVAVVKTDVLWDQRADAVFRKGWQENLEEWNQVGSDRPYHYLGSCVCYSRMGRAFGEAMLKLLDE